MRDLRTSRKGYNFKCYYWNRANFNQSSEELVHKTTCSGSFYAKIVSDKDGDKENMAGNVFRVGFQTLSVETNDIIDLKKDDIVQLNGKNWIVTRVSERLNQKNAEFSSSMSKKTIISLQTGE